MAPNPSRQTAELVVGDLQIIRAKLFGDRARVRANMITGPFGLAPTASQQEADELRLNEALEVYDHLIGLIEDLGGAGDGKRS